MQANEALVAPYHASQVPYARNVLVFAPHPDDEVFGCGGAMALHARDGSTVHVVLLTSGTYGEAIEGYGVARENESARAARILGVATPRPWRLADRTLEYGEDLVDRMVSVIGETLADVVYAPSLWELHPDHRATALSAMEAVRRSGRKLELMFYEVSSPLRPNCLIDLGPVDGVKQAAMQQFLSQEAKLPYASFVNALNRFRALTLYPAAESAEAFERYSAEDLASGSSHRLASELVRMRSKGIAGSPADLPMVSVIIRTIGRATLSDALRSVAAQTYHHLDVVIVDASGTLEVAKLKLVAQERVRIVSSDVPLRRAAAANLGLRTAEGEYFLFLDDDDWLYPDHIAKLVRTVLASPSARAAHTAVECVDEQGVPLSEVFDLPYTRSELQFGNFMPIHAVLFHRSLVKAGIAFDESFDLYEDWDFWLQVERLTPYAFVPGVSAAYRIHAGAGAGMTVDRELAREATQRLYNKWGVFQSAQTFDALITRALQLRKMQRFVDARSDELCRLTSELEIQQRAALQAQRETSQAARDADHFRKAHEEAVRARDILNEHLVRVVANNDRLAGQQEALLTQLQLLRDQNSLQTEEVRRYAAEAAKLSKELPLSRDHSSNLQQLLDTATRELEAVLGSTSWQLTRPLRRVGRELNRIKLAARAYRAARRGGVSGIQLASRIWAVFRSEGYAGVRMRAHRLMLRNDGPGEAALPVSENGEPTVTHDYTQWVREFDTAKPSDVNMMLERAGRLAEGPVVSIVMPVHNPQLEDLRRAIASVQGQYYPQWQLCICDDASTSEEIWPFISQIAATDSRIHLARHAVNAHISSASNTALEMATGELVAFLDQDDELRPHALLMVVEAFKAQPTAQLLYSDEDKLSTTGVRFDPYFKPDFNLGLLRSHNYMCHLAVYRRSLLIELGGLRMGFEGAQDYDLVLRAVDRVGSVGIIHVPRVLYHWRVSVGSTAAGHDNKSYAFDAGRRALAEHLERRSLAGDVLEAPEARGMYRIRWHRPNPAPLVSIVIPTRNGTELVRQCLDSLKLTAYPTYEVILIDNGSDDAAALALLAEREAAGQIRILRDDSPFNFSALNNRAIRKMARGEFVLLMNNDIEITHAEWLDEMVGAAMEPGVGCVGARLWYPNDRLQHGGVILVCGVAGHAHKYLQKGEHGYMGRAVLAQDFVAVTGACLLVRRAIFDEVGGLDEKLEVAFNDVDFCLRVYEAGYRNHWTPYAELVHHESLTRGYEDTPEKQRRFKREIDILQARWSHLLGHDPFYSPNLTNDAEDFSFAWPPRHSSYSSVFIT